MKAQWRLVGQTRELTRDDRAGVLFEVIADGLRSDLCSLLMIISATLTRPTCVCGSWSASAIN